MPLGMTGNTTQRAGTPLPNSDTTLDAPTIPSPEWFAQFKAIAERAEATRSPGALAEPEPPATHPAEAG